jgi:hypothetical protein
VSAFEPGLYKARILKWQVGESAAKGTPQLVFTISPECRLIGTEELPCDPVERNVFLYFTDGTIERVNKTLLALGYDRDSYDQLEPDHPDAFDFAGKEVKAEMKVEKYKEKDQERWELRVGNGLEVKKMDRQGMSKLNATFGSKLKQAGLAKPPRPAAPPVSGDSDEVF